MSAAESEPKAAKGGRSFLVPLVVALLAGTGGAAAAFTQGDAIRQAVGGAPAEEVVEAPAPVEYGELRLPAGNGPHPVGVLIHGGFWKEMWTLDLMDGLAVDLDAGSIVVDWDPDF